MVFRFLQVTLGIDFFETTCISIRYVELIFVFHFDNLANSYWDSQDMVLSKEENLVPENSTQINLKTIAEKSDDPLK